MSIQNSDSLPVATPLSRCALLALFLAIATPAAAQNQPSPTGISGYMDFHYNKFEDADGVLDFHRFVLLFTHEFSPRIRFVSELELEHAFVEGLAESGEIELEQAYIDFLLDRRFNLRAGMMLVPVGIINERHEPPVYSGVERPLVDTVIVPSTWFEAGVGIHGEVGRGWRYRAYLMAPLNAAKFSADEGLRNGRQKGGETNIGRVALTGRVEYVGIRGFTMGASFWTGDSGFEFRPRFDVPVRVAEIDARYSRDRIDLRAQLAHVGIEGAADLNDALMRQSGVNPNIARSLRGAYAEAGYRIVSGRPFGDIGAFVRYEDADTQHRMPDGALPLGEFRRTAWVVGGTYWPEPDIAIKVDYVIERNQSATIDAPNSFNVGLGWWF